MNRKGAAIPSLAKEFNVGEQTIRDWKKNEKVIQRMVERNKISRSNRKILRHSNYPETDEALGIWFSQQKALNKPLSRTVLIEKAREFRTKCDQNQAVRIKDFEASSGFIDKFCQRHGIKINLSSLSSISSSITTKTMKSSSFKEDLNRLVKKENYSPSQLYFLCEAGLFWNSWPKLSTESDLNGKHSNLRIHL